MLLSECDMNCYPDSSGKAIITTSSPIASVIQTDTSLLYTTANNSFNSYNGNNLDTLDDEDEDDNRIG